MPARFVPVDRNSPLLLSPDLRDWVPRDHLSHFVVDTVDAVYPSNVSVNWRGSGSAQYPPSMMCCLLIYCYVTGRFSSRVIERATYDDVAVRYITGDTHPDHDTICKFRRENGEAFRSLFVNVLDLAREMAVLKQFGTVSIDGTKVLANASKHKAVSYERAGEMIGRFEQEVAELVERAENADSAPLADGLSIPEEISRREERIARLKEAREAIEARARIKAEQELATLKATGQGGRKRPGPKPRKPRGTPKGKSQYNFTDPDSRIMKAGNGKHFEQSYNAQAAVEVESRLIVGQSVTDEPNDKRQLVPVVKAIDKDFTPETVLADSGYNSQKAIEAVELDAQGRPTGTIVLAAQGRTGHNQGIASLEKTAGTDQDLGNTAGEPMAERMDREPNRKLYKQRKQTVEPVFGIIKEAMGFRRFSMRGRSKVGDEWALVTSAYNIKRLFHIGVSSVRTSSLHLLF